jgi:hypothetical protein
MFGSKDGEHSLHNECNIVTSRDNPAEREQDADDEWTLFQYLVSILRYFSHTHNPADCL